MGGMVSLLASLRDAWTDRAYARVEPRMRPAVAPNRARDDEPPRRNEDAPATATSSTSTVGATSSASTVGAVRRRRRPRFDPATATTARPRPSSPSLERGASTAGAEKPREETGPNLTPIAALLRGAAESRKDGDAPSDPASVARGERRSPGPAGGRGREAPPATEDDGQDDDGRDVATRLDFGDLDDGRALCETLLVILTAPRCGDRGARIFRVPWLDAILEIDEDDASDRAPSARDLRRSDVARQTLSILRDARAPRRAVSELRLRASLGVSYFEALFCGGDGRSRVLSFWPCSSCACVGARFLHHDRFDGAAWTIGGF